MVIRNKVHEFYKHRRILDTLNTLLRALREDIKYTGSSWLLRKTLRKLGFTWKSTRNNRKVLVEMPHIVAQRFYFYANNKCLEEKGFTLVFVDET